MEKCSIRLRSPISCPDNVGNKEMFCVGTFIPDLRLMFSNRRLAEKNIEHKMF